MAKTNNYAIVAILCLQTACHCVIQTIGQYVYLFYLQLYPIKFNSTGSINSSYDASETVNDGLEKCASDTSNHSIFNAQQWAQERSADLFYHIGLWNSCPLIVMTYILGLYTTRLGRQVVLILPMVGITIQFVIWLAIIYFRLADYWWYIASFIVGLSGSQSVLNYMMSLIITDETRENHRSSRFVLLETVTTIVNAAVTFIIGYYITWRGFTDLLWISISFEMLSIVIVVFSIENRPRPMSNRDRDAPLLSTNATHRDAQTKSSHSLRSYCEDYFIIFHVFRSKNRSHKKSVSLLLTLFAYIFYLLTYSTYASFLWYLLNVPFCWTSENVGNYTALTSILCAIFSLVGMKLLTRIGADDIVICTIGHLCYAAVSFLYAFAKHSWQLYAGLAVMPFADYQHSLTLPMMAKWLEPHERVHAFTFVAEVNTIISSFGDSFFNWVYARTVVNYRNFTILLGATFSVISFLLNLRLLAVLRGMPDEAASSVSSTEPLIMPIDDATFSVDFIGPPLPHLVSAPQIHSVDHKSETNSQSSTDSELILTDNLISI